MAIIPETMQIRLFTIPNILTLCNLLCGAMASVAALVQSDLVAAFWFIVLGAVFDFLDGFSARLLKMPSPIGIELDSLADVLTFGFAPSAVLFRMYLEADSIWSAGTYVGLATFILVAFAALRLAKFNIDDTQTTEFCGLPTPAGGLFCASLGMLWQQGRLPITGEAIVAVAFVIALLLISPIRMFSLKFHGFGWRGNELRYLFLLVCVTAIITLRAYSIPVIIVLYIVVSTVRWVRAWVKSPEKARKA